MFSFANFYSPFEKFLGFSKRVPWSGVARYQQASPILLRHRPQLNPAIADSDRSCLVHSASLMSQWELACRLREYVYRVTPWAISAKSRVLAAGEHHWAKIYSGQITLWDHFKFMRRLQGGHFCGGTAAILTALAQAFGLDAWFLNTGFDETAATHSLTLIKLSFEGESVYTLHDPTINVSYTHRDQKTPIDYFEIIRFLLQGDEAQVARVEIGDSRPPVPAIALAFDDDLIDRSPVDPGTYGWLVDQHNYKITQVQPGVWVLRSPRTPANFEKLYQSSCQRSLEAKGYPDYSENSIYMNLLPFQILGICPAESRCLLHRAIDLIER